MFSICTKIMKSLKRNVFLLDRINPKSTKLRLTPVMAPIRFITTTTVLSHNNNNKDPFEELLKIIEHSSHAQEPKDSILTKEPPISIKDLDGNPIEPIDIDAWKDPKELLGLFGNIDYFERKVRSRQNDPIAEPIDDLTKVIHDEIANALGNFKIKNENVKAEKQITEVKQEVREMNQTKEDKLSQDEETITVIPTGAKQTDVKATSPANTKCEKTNK